MKLSDTEGRKKKKDEEREEKENIKPSPGQKGGAIGGLKGKGAGGQKDKRGTKVVMLDYDWILE